MLRTLQEEITSTVDGRLYVGVEGILTFTQSSDYERVKILRGGRPKCIRYGMGLWNGPTSLARVARAEYTHLVPSDPKRMCLV